MQHKVVDHLKILIVYVTESGRSCCQISDLGRLQEMAAMAGWAESRDYQYLEQGGVSGDQGTG